MKASLLNPCRSPNVFLGGMNFPEVATSSYFLSARPLLIYRILAFLICASLIIFGIIEWIVIRTDVIYYSYLFYLTTLSFYSVTIYLGIAAWLTYRGLSSAYVPSPLLSTVYTWIYISNAAIQPLVVLIYWLFLYKDHVLDNKYSQAVAVLDHTVGLTAVILDLVLGRMQMPFWNMLLLPLITLLYLAYVVVYFFLSRSWIYTLLDPASSQAFYMYPVLIVSPFVTFLVMHLLHRLRDRLFASQTGKKQPCVSEPL